MSVKIAITARKGKGKHDWECQGVPLIVFPITEAILATPDKVSIWTDCEEMQKIAISAGVEVQYRPPETCTDDSPHKDIISHIAREWCEPDDILIVLLGNCPTVDHKLILQAVEMLQNEPDLTGVCTVWQAQDDHPLRALRLNHTGHLEARENGNQTSTRQSYPPVFYYDQQVWAFRAVEAIKQEGPSPWVWLGNRCKPIICPWVTGRDVHGKLDIVVAESILKSCK